MKKLISGTMDIFKKDCFELLMCAICFTLVVSEDDDFKNTTDLIDMLRFQYFSGSDTVDIFPKVENVVHLG